MVKYTIWSPAGMSAADYHSVTEALQARERISRICGVDSKELPIYYVEVSWAVVDTCKGRVCMRVDSVQEAQRARDAIQEAFIQWMREEWKDADEALLREYAEFRYKVRQTTKLGDREEDKPAAESDDAEVIEIPDKWDE